ncbi:MAG: acyltransferase family protein, partial [Xanthobacteraceae bacterium]
MDTVSHKHHHLIGLDVARFIAACAVMMFHLAFWSWISVNTTPGKIVGGVAKFPELISISWWGRFGVDLFFTISGFVIAYSASNSSAAAFLRGRFLRLFPAALICATVTLIVRLYFNPEDWRTLVWFYWNSISFDLFGGWIDGSYWT